MQAVVHTEQDILLTVSEDPLFWKGGDRPIVRVQAELDGAAAAAVRTEVKLVGLVEDADRAHRPDPLLDAAYVPVERGDLQQIWVECHAGEHAQAGKLHGRVRLYVRRMFEDEALIGECSFTVTVHEDRLPESRDYSFYLDLWQHSSNIARKYDVPPWSDAHFRILDRYLASLAELGQKALSVVVSDAPWCGQSSYRDREPSDVFEYGMVRVTKRKAGRFEYDFSAVERYVRLGEKHGIRAEIELFGLLNVWTSADAPAWYGALANDYPDAIRVRYYDEAAGIHRYIRGKEELEAYIAAVHDYFVSTGRAERVRVTADEPADIGVFLQRLESLRRLAPRFRYKLAFDKGEFMRRPIDGIADAVPFLGCVARQYEDWLARKGERAGRWLYYVCSGPRRPNTFLSSPGLECRLLPWLAEWFGFEGLLRWSYTCWPDRPLEQPYFRPGRWATGDLFLIYPGRDGKPMLSLRYKWLQRGIRDVELMRLLKAKGEEKRVASAMQRVIRFAHPRELLSASGKAADELYSLDPQDYELLAGKQAT